MSWKSLVITGLLCVVASPVLAAPTLSIDLVRDGSNLPVLTAAGDWQWVVSVTPDAALFADNPPNGVGGSVAVELAIEATGSSLVSVTKNATNFPNDNPGTAVATYPTGLGVQVAGNKAVAALGSTYFTTGGAKEMLTIVTDGPSTTGSLTSGISLLGAYAGGYRLAQDGTNFDIAASSISKTVLGGDANLNGTVNISDFGILQANFNGTSKVWQTGDFNGTGSANITDFGILQANFNQSIAAPGGGSLAAAGVPEPTTAMLLLVAACTAAGLRRSRS
jgi:hypothetical protein